MVGEGRGKELKKEGKTIFYISHSLTQMRSFCDLAIWIEGGLFQEIGPIKEVCDHYEFYMDSIKKLSAKEQKQFKNNIFESRIKK